jgi:glycerol-3-phosphate acyltransferase PlsY
LPDFNLEFVVILLVCYLFGSFPTAYLLVKSFSKKSVIHEGSGNVGTYNAYTVSKSKMVGILVLILDFLKGSVPMLFLIIFFKLNFIGICVCSLFIILGHNYSIWLKFKGGRGLATAAGIFVVLNFVMLIGWCVVWVISFLFKKDILISNVAATLSMPLLAIIFRSIFIAAFEPQIGMNNYLYFIIFVSAVTVLILSRHMEVIKSFKKNSKNLNN